MYGTLGKPRAYTNGTKGLLLVMGLVDFTLKLGTVFEMGKSMYKDLTNSFTYIKYRDHWVEVS